MNLDLIIRNATVIDGTGAPRYGADIAVADGKIVDIGEVTASARGTIDAARHVVAPGFIDPHTHYDAQLWWDEAVTPSPWHGVTTVVMGNCGVGIAPCTPAARDAVLHDLVNVEGMPYDVMKAGVTWDWESFPEFMEAADKRKLAINLAFLAPLTPFRAYVMGQAATERAANPGETAIIAKLLSEAMEAGAVGFSTTLLQNHMGRNGRPLGCRLANEEELRAYAGVLKSAGKGAGQLALTRQVSHVTDEEYRVLEMLLDSGRPVTFSAMLYRDDWPDVCEETFRKLEPLLARGLKPQTSARPLLREFDLRAPFSFQGFVSFSRVLNRSVEEQKAIYADRAFRDQFRDELNRADPFNMNWDLMAASDIAHPALKAFEGWTIGEIARKNGTDGVDALLDLAVDDNLQTEFTVALLNTNVEGVGRLMADPRLLIGLGDGGAHIGMLCDSGYTTFLLGTWVRERKALSLEHAVKRLTSEPADFFGIPDRGRLKPGAVADLVIFDPDTVGSAEKPERRFDLPLGGKRVVMMSEGIDYTIVNGAVVYDHGAMTDNRPGRVVRA